MASVDAFSCFTAPLLDSAILLEFLRAASLIELAAKLAAVYTASASILPASVMALLAILPDIYSSSVAFYAASASAFFASWMELDNKSIALAADF